MSTDQYTLSHQEVVKALVIDQHIHEGLWTLHLDFHIGYSHAPRSIDPTLTVTIKGVGIMRAVPTDPFAVDAALVNPAPATRDESPTQVPHANGTQAHAVQFGRDAYRQIAIQSTIRLPGKAD